MTDKELKDLRDRNDFIDTKIAIRKRKLRETYSHIRKTVADCLSIVDAYYVNHPEFVKVAQRPKFRSEQSYWSEYNTMMQERHVAHVNNYNPSTQYQHKCTASMI